MIQKKTKQIIYLQKSFNERAEPVFLNKLNQNDWAPIGAVRSQRVKKESIWINVNYNWEKIISNKKARKLKKDLKDCFSNRWGNCKYYFKITKPKMQF